jgi:hypothetical protein
MALPENLNVLELHVPEIKGRTVNGPFANDIYESIDDWCHSACDRERHSRELSWTRSGNEQPCNADIEVMP